MEEFGQMLMYTVPSVVVGAIAYLLVHRFIQNEQNRHLMEVKKENIKFSAPIILQAHERLILFLERMQMSSLVARVHKPGMSARFLQTEIINTIKTEFEHNITQQLYVSKNSWEIVKKAKEESMKTVSMGMSKLQDNNATSIDLAREVLTITAAQDQDWTQKAIDVLKADLRKTF
ncbi:MAG: hypothetical protein NT150_04770 [Bacteroidetes bacterium]|nr:hypothetical protein [Bacteroidota bacterium]